MNAQYFYFTIPLKLLEAKMAHHQKKFDDVLEICFSEDEIITIEHYLDQLGAVFVQPMITELTFDDLNFEPSHEVELRDLFSRCKSSICLENLPFFENNPFQVSYLSMLLAPFNEVLIDPGLHRSVMPKDEYLKFLSKFKNADQLLNSTPAPKISKPLSIPVTPIDFLIRDVYKEIERIRDIDLEIMPEKCQMILKPMLKEKLQAEELFSKSGLNPKSFDDHLEKLKFTLKKIP